MKKLLILPLLLLGFNVQAQSASDYPHEGLDTCENETLLPARVDTLTFEGGPFSLTDNGKERKFEVWRRRCGNSDYDYQVVLSAYVSDDLDLPSTFTIEFEQGSKTETENFPFRNAISSNQSKVIASSTSYPYIEYHKEVVMNVCNVSCSYSKMLSFKMLDVSSYNPNTLKGISGAWYDPSYNGLGFNVLQSTSGYAMYFYGYKKDVNGQAQWLSSAIGPKEIVEGQTFNLTMYSGFPGNGGSFTAKPTTDQAGLKEWGTAEITFNSCTTGVITLTGDDGSLTHNIVKLVGIEDTICTD